MPFKWAFLFILGLFKRTLQFLQQSYVKKILSRIHCWDLNPQPLERESPPITTRPRLPLTRIPWLLFGFCVFRLREISCLLPMRIVKVKSERI